jgi:tetratricopeptide (TPR) repeat protein
MVDFERRRGDRRDSVEDRLKVIVESLHNEMINEIDLLFKISEKVMQIRHCSSHNKIGILFLQNNLVDDATRHFQMAIEINPHNLEGYNNLGQAYIQSGNYQKAIDVDSKNIPARAKMAEIYINDKKATDLARELGIKLPGTELVKNNSSELLTRDETKKLLENLKQTSPAIVEGRVVFGSHDHHCYCLRLSDGAEFWRRKFNHEVHAPPAVANGVVYVGTWEWKLHALDLAWPDLAIIAVYLVGIVGLGLWAWKGRRSL